MYNGSFYGVDPQTFLSYVGETAKAFTSITRYNRAGLQLLPRKSSKYIDGKRTFYHPLSIIEFLTADYLNKGKLCTQKQAKNNITQLQNEDIFFGRINAYFMALSNAKADSAAAKEFMDIIRSESAFMEHFVTRTDIVSGKPSSIRMTRVDVSNQQHENLFYLTNYLGGSREVAKSYINWVTHLYVHVFMKIYNTEWEKMKTINLVKVEPSPLSEELAEGKTDAQLTG